MIPYKLDSVLSIVSKFCRGKAIADLDQRSRRVSASYMLPAIKLRAIDRVVND